jgi:O-antigen/teichoic acid export membrane protein
MSAQYVSFILQFAVSIVVARFFLRPEEVGLFSLALSAAALLAVLQDFGLTRFITGHPDPSPALIRTCFSVSVLFALGIAGAVVAAAWPAAYFYDDPRLLPLLLIIAGSYLLAPFAIVPGALIQRQMDFRSMFAVNVGAAFANGAVTLLLAWLDYSAAALAWGMVAQQAARALLSQWRSGWYVPLPLGFAEVRQILRFGSGSSALAISGGVGIRSPELIIGRILTLTAVGLWGRAVGLASQLRELVSGGIAGVFYPAFARIRDKGEDLAPHYLRMVAGYSGVTWPAMAFLAAAATPLVLLLYGPVWKGVAPLVVWIALSEIIFTALPLHMEIPILLGRMRRLLQLNLLDTIASVALLVLGATQGLEWAAGSRIAYGMMWFCIYAAFMRRLIGFRWRAILNIYVRSLAASAVTVAPLLAVYWHQKPDSVGFATLAASALIGCFLWLATIFLIRHPVRHEIAAIFISAREALRSPVPLRRN